MGEIFFINPQHEQFGPVAPDVYSTFSNYLMERRYSDSTIRAYTASLRHFGYWLAKMPVCEKEINHRTVQTFLDRHLPVCRCPDSFPRNLKTVRAALNQLLQMKGLSRFIESHGETPPEIAAAIEDFDCYLARICGLAEATCWYHRRHVRIFLLWLFTEEPVEINKITPEAICRFVAQQAGKYRTGSMGVMVYSLRTYLKFLRFAGHETVCESAKIPRPPNWSAANLPNALRPDELKKFWDAFNRSTAIGKRDYAMARCLADLGLRCCEVSQLQLQSFDWHRGLLSLTKTKSRREDILPIPDATGQAVVNYLREGRPETKSRAVFVHHRAPVGIAVQGSTVRGVVRRAFSRAGLTWTGTHILRSTIASRLLNGGVSLKEIADILRHRSLDTTRLYTKIDLGNLSHVALPWPERSGS